MSKGKDEEVAQVYYIPANYDESGGVLGGRIGTRNAVELGIFCGPIAYLEYHLLHFSIQTNLIIALITILPIAFLCVFGLGGESLSQLIVALIRYMRGRRVLHYDMFTPYDGDTKKGINIDKFLDTVSSSGIKAAIAKFREEKAEQDKATGREDTCGGVQKRKRTRLFRKTKHEVEEGTQEMKADLRRQEREIKGQTKGWLSAARKDKGHSLLNNPNKKRR